jgi:Ca2+-binding RTX toxin-like protein
MPTVRIGTNTDDTLVGTILDDIIVALGGNDNADGGAGNDTLLGGAGRDTIVGGDGADSLSGEDGDDLLFGGAGRDTLLGGAGNDLLVWNNGDGSDAVTGGSGVDTAIVNGAGSAGDLFTVTGGGMDLLLSLAGPGIALNLFQIEALEIYGQGGDDRLVVGDVSGTSLQQIYFEGGLGDDTLDATAATRVSLPMGVMDPIFSPADKAPTHCVVASMLTFSQAGRATISWTGDPARTDFFGALGMVAIG